ncbi:hypothetical protein BB560_003247, partial [Smittium megazygosporum]
MGNLRHRQPNLSQTPVQWITTKKIRLNTTVSFADKIVCGLARALANEHSPCGLLQQMTRQQQDVILVL